MKMTVRQRPIKSLVPYLRNARTHNARQVDQIANSILEFGWTNPVLVDGNNGIIAGHGRVLAAQQLEMTKVPCIELSGLTEEQKRAYIIADNKLALESGWDTERLQLELGELKGLGFDISLTGFDDDALAELQGLGGPDGFTEYDESISTEHECPKCGYKWT